jgi:antitoxin component YwqK of YwqJK toxin-antitoxin module
MRFFLVLFTAAFLFSCNNRQENKSISKNYLNTIPNVFVTSKSPLLRNRNDTYYYNDSLFSGFLIEISELSKDTLSRESFLNGKRSGMQQKWFAKSKIKEIRFYVDGKKNGLQTAYWENGNKKFEFVAIDDAYNGELREWTSEGHLIHQANFVNGQEEGPQKLWYDNGKIRANYIIRDGKRYGLLGTKNCVNVSDSVFTSN